MARPRTYGSEFTAHVIDHAGRLLAAEGPGALTVRRLADEVDASTGAIYRTIGLKNELVRAMYLEGFARLEAELATVPEELGPAERLRALGLAYQRSALASPHLYTVMFERPVPEFQPSDEDRAYALSTLQVLIDEVRRAISCGVLTAARGGAEDVAVRLWATNHGITSLAIAEMLGGASPAEHLEAMMDAIFIGMRP